MAGLKQLNWASEGVGATAAALVDLSTVAGNKISNPPWVKFQSAGWVNFPSAPTAVSLRAFTVEGLECNNALTESAIAEQLCEAGFHGITYELASEVPVSIQDGIEFRLFTVSAYKGKAGVCLDQGHAVIYKGPWKHTVDDDGHTYQRGIRTAVCEKTFNLLMSAPYQGQFIPVRCYVEPALDKSGFFDCNTPSVRDPKVTKGLVPIAGSAEESCCADGTSCC